MHKSSLGVLSFSFNSVAIVFLVILLLVSLGDEFLIFTVSLFEDTDSLLSESVLLIFCLFSICSSTLSALRLRVLLTFCSLSGFASLLWVELKELEVDELSGIGSIISDNVDFRLSSCELYWQISDKADFWLNSWELGSPISDNVDFWLKSWLLNTESTPESTISDGLVTVFWALVVVVRLLFRFGLGGK